MDSVMTSRRSAAALSAWGLRSRLIRGLLYQEWLARGRLLAAYATTWVIGVWVLPCFTHPAWYLALSGIFAFVSGARFGGADVFDGTEEFCFALPPRRLTRYFVRLALGLGVMIALTVLGLVLTRFSVPQAVWGLVVESGFTGQSPAVAVEWYARALAYPALLFAVLFSLAAVCQSRNQLHGATGIGAVVVCGLSVYLEASVLPKTVWWVPFALLTLVAVLAVALSAAFYARKEGVSRPVRHGLDRRWLVATIIAIAFMLFLFLTVNFAPRRGEEPMRQQTEPHETTESGRGF